MAYHTGDLAAGTYSSTPFVGRDNLGVCMPQAVGCSESAADDSITVTFTVPAGWAGADNTAVTLLFGGDSTAVLILRGGSLYSDPCHATPPPDIAVGPTVDDFANALADHPLLEVTTPTPVTLAGYSGKYVELQFPADVNCGGGSAGPFWPWEPGMYAQGPSQRWHLWILDVKGTRVVVQSMDYPETPVARQQELQAIVNSIQIKP